MNKDLYRATHLAGKIFRVNYLFFDFFTTMIVSLVETTFLFFLFFLISFSRNYFLAGKVKGLQMLFCDQAFFIFFTYFCSS